MVALAVLLASSCSPDDTNEIITDVSTNAARVESEIAHLVDARGEVTVKQISPNVISVQDRAAKEVAKYEFPPGYNVKVSGTGAIGLHKGQKKTIYAVIDSGKNFGSSLSYPPLNP